MRRFSAGSKFMIIPGLTALLVLLPSCRRAPEVVEVEPSATSSVPSTPTPRVRLSTLEPPQESSKIGITVNALPSGLVITSNDDLWLEVTDSRRLSVQYTFVALPPEADGISLANVGDFEGFLPSFENREPDSEGTVTTRFGEARWASGMYLEYDEELVDVRVFAPHPSGTGILAVYSACPPGVASVEERLAIIQNLLENVS